MSAIIDLQNNSNDENTPSLHAFQMWVDAVFAHQHLDAELTIRLVDNEEMTILNEQYRHKEGPTNVLSFPFEGEFEAGCLPLIGDIVICVPVVLQESDVQRKNVEAHFAHLTIHGVLHLLGYDHVHEADAIEMENLEIQFMQALNYDNPYAAGYIK